MEVIELAGIVNNLDLYEFLIKQKVVEIQKFLNKTYKVIVNNNLWKAI